jgi:hypothetical protein
MPKLYFIEGECSSIKDDYEYAKCAYKNIEALKTDREILQTRAQECVK